MRHSWIAAALLLFGLVEAAPRGEVEPPEMIRVEIEGENDIVVESGKPFTAVVGGKQVKMKVGVAANRRRSRKSSPLVEDSEPIDRPSPTPGAERSLVHRDRLVRLCLTVPPFTSLPIRVSSRSSGRVRDMACTASAS